MPYQITRARNFYRAALIVLLAGLVGCATTPPVESFVPPVYPAPPDPARFVYERSYSFADNVERPATFGEKLQRFASGEEKKARGLVKPYDVTEYQGRIYVTDTVQRRVVVFDAAAGRYFEFGVDKPGELAKPIGIAAAGATGEVFVADVSLRRVHVYTSEGKFLRAVGNQETLQRPTGVAVNHAGTRVYIVDTGGVTSQEHRVQVYDAQSGALLQTIGTRGEGDGQFNLPVAIDVGLDGTIYVLDKMNFRVEIFNPDGSFKAKFGSLGRYPGQLASGRGIAVDKDNNIYVVDTAFGNFQIFNQSGQLLLFIGERGASGKPGQYQLPAGIHVDAQGRIYVVDQFFRKVDVYKPVVSSVS